jgi:hypothetical protein
MKIYLGASGAIDFLHLAEGRGQTKRRSVQASPQGYTH